MMPNVGIQWLTFPFWDRFVSAVIDRFIASIRP